MVSQEWALIPIETEEQDKPAAVNRGVYATMLTEFLRGPHARARVMYAGRNVQAIYMGLRQARKTDARFAYVDITKFGNNESGEVVLSKRQSPIGTASDDQ